VSEVEPNVTVQTCWFRCESINEIILLTLLLLTLCHRSRKFRTLLVYRTGKRPRLPREVMTTCHRRILEPTLFSLFSTDNNRLLWTTFSCRHLRKSLD